MTDKRTAPAAAGQPATGQPRSGSADRAGERWALVLAGGDGTRLQELTRAITGTPIPKQYCRILGEQSLLETTLARVIRFAPPERTIVVVSRPHRRLAQGQVGHLPSGNLLVQRCNRDTGPGILFGLLEIARRAPEARVAVFPSDHYVGNEAAFLAHLTRAARLVELCPEKIALLGFRPERAEPGYGYIQPAGPLELPGCGSAFHVEAFHEKPTAEHARLIARIGGLWNSLVMVFEVARMLALMQLMRSAEFEDMRSLAHDPAATDRAYPHLARWNFSSDFLTRVPRHLAVLPVNDVPRSDWGTPEAVERTLLQLRRALPWRTFRAGPAHGSLPAATADARRAGCAARLRA